MSDHGHGWGASLGIVASVLTIIAAWYTIESYRAAPEPEPLPPQTRSVATPVEDAVDEHRPQGFVEAPPAASPEPAPPPVFTRPSTPAAAAPAPAPAAARARPEAPPAPRYVNAGVLAGLGARGPVAVLAGGGGDTERVSAGLRAAGVRVQTGLFTGSAARDGIVGRLRDGDAALLSELGLDGVPGALVFADLRLGESVDTGQLFRTFAELSVTLVPFDGSGPTHLRLEERGAGFDPQSANRQAESRVMEQLASRLRGVGSP